MKKSYPGIGIRPIIDGRRGGIRESLEEKTMKMASMVAELYEKELKYSDGTPVLWPGLSNLSSSYSSIRPMSFCG